MCRISFGRTCRAATAAAHGVRAPTAPAAPPRLPSACVATDLTDRTFDCLSDDDVIVVVLGTKGAEGPAYCDGVEVAHGYKDAATRTGSGTSATSSDGSCELVDGITAVCIATGPA